MLYASTEGGFVETLDQHIKMVLTFNSMTCSVMKCHVLNPKALTDKLDTLSEKISQLNERLEKKTSILLL